MSIKEQIKECNTFEELVEVLNKLHVDGRDPKYDNEHVVCIFSDGEVCNTKGGSLFLERNMHQMIGGCLSKEMQLKGLKDKFKDYGMVVTEGIPYSTLNEKLKELKATYVSKPLDITRSFDVDISHLKPILSYEDSPEVLGLYFWGNINEEEGWLKHPVSEREYKRVKYMTNDVNIALRLVLEGYANLYRVLECKDGQVDYEIECIQYY